MKHLKFIIPGAVGGLLLAGYVGLSLYSSNQAEKQIEDWLYDNELDGMSSGSRSAPVLSGQRSPSAGFLWWSRKHR